MPVETVNVTGPVPLYVLALHNIAKIGKASEYFGQMWKFAAFDLTSPEHEVLQTSFTGLRDVDRITLIYNTRKERSTVL